MSKYKPRYARKPIIEEQEIQEEIVQEPMKESVPTRLPQNVLTTGITGPLPDMQEEEIIKQQVVAPQYDEFGIPIPQVSRKEPSKLANALSWIIPGILGGPGGLAQRYLGPKIAEQQRQQEAINQYRQERLKAPSDIRSFRALQRMPEDDRSEFMKYKSMTRQPVGPSPWDVYKFETKREDIKSEADAKREERQNKFSADLYEKRSDAQNVLNSIAKIGELWSQIPTGRVSGALTKGKSLISENVSLSQVTKLRDTIKSQLSRLSGQSGVLTDKDVAYVEGILGRVYETPEEIKAGLEEASNFIRNKIKNYETKQRIFYGLESPFTKTRSFKKSYSTDKKTELEMIDAAIAAKEGSI